MKTLLAFLFASILFVSCKDNKTYTMKTYYLQATASSPASIVIRDRPFTASTDTMAFKKASGAFASIKDKSNDKSNIPLKFELYNNHDQLIVINLGKFQNWVCKELMNDFW